MRENATERQVEDLAEIADVVIHTDRSTPSDVLVRVASHIGLYGRENHRLVDVIIGGGYGSEGKGHRCLFVDRIRFPRSGGRAKCRSFSLRGAKPLHFPSSSFWQSRLKRTLIIGPGAVLYVPELQREIAECRIEQSRLTIDPQAMIISEADRRRERRLQESIGSTGRGVGFATARRIIGRGQKSLS